MSAETNLRYALYGVNRVAKDFMYIFDNLLITCIFTDSSVEKVVFCNKNVYKIDEYRQYKELFDKIIICDFEKEEKEKKLSRLGLRYGQDYIYEKDLFKKLNKMQINPQNKKLVMWGTGKRARGFQDWNQDKGYEIESFIDSNKSKQSFFGKRVYLPSEIEEWQDRFVVIAVAQDTEICEFLEAQGLQKYVDFCNVQDMMRMPSELLRETIFDQNCYDLECSTMLNHIELQTGGHVYNCCTSFVENAIGNVEDEPIKEIWNSSVHKIMCLSNENRTYSFCNKKMCPFFIGKEASIKIELDREYERMRSMPKTVAIGFDASCNLQCETCRSELHIAKEGELERVTKYANIVKHDLLPECEFLIMAGNGEVFASQAYKDVYSSKEIAQIKNIRILSNGTLFNEKNWREFSTHNKGKIMLTVSIDAATKETYEAIRRNGNFDILRKNMEFAAQLRKEGKLVYFRLNFVVQKRNYKEMVDFVKWGLELGVDEIFFTKILNWGTYTSEEFKEISMMEEDGITPKKELERVLNHPVMKHSIVDLGTIRYARESVKENKIENYYKWEVERRGKGCFFD